MTRWLATTRGRVLIAVAFVLALLAAWPLRMAFSVFGLAPMGVAARSLRGPVWWGTAEQLELHGIRLGTVHVHLSPWQLFLGRAHIDISRQLGKPDDIRGALTVGIGGVGLDHVTGSLPLAAALAPLPVSRVDLDDLSVRFAGGSCASAQGRVRAHVPTLIAGLNLANGLGGTLRCAGNQVILPLASQSGRERLDVRIGADGQYQATMRVRTDDPLLVQALGANGFRAVNGAQQLRILGQL